MFESIEYAEGMINESILDCEPFMVENHGLGTVYFGYRRSKRGNTDILICIKLEGVVESYLYSSVIEMIFRFLSVSSMDSSDNINQEKIETNASVGEISQLSSTLIKIHKLKPFRSILNIKELLFQLIWNDLI